MLDESQSVECDFVTAQKRLLVTYRPITRWVHSKLGILGWFQVINFQSTDRQIGCFSRKLPSYKLYLLVGAILIEREV